jgi:cytochrome c peroxidase
MLMADDIHAAGVGFDEKKVRKEIEEILDGEMDHGPLFVRLSWHASGTFDKVSNTGGSFGATMRFAPESKHGANAGLNIARDLLEPVKERNPGISYADLWTLAGVHAIEEMGGPTIGFTPGRKDGTAADCTPDGRLPDADKGSKEQTIQHIRDVFYRMGFDDKEIVALLGAHALGRCHVTRSGYWGPWTRAPTTFSNEYFRLLLDEKWTIKKVHHRDVWTGPEQYEDPTGELMMLPSDMALVWDPAFRKHVEHYATEKGHDDFFNDFAKAFQKLNELGSGVGAKPWYQIW